MTRSCCSDGAVALGAVAWGWAIGLRGAAWDQLPTNEPGLEGVKVELKVPSRASLGLTLRERQ